LRRLTGIEIAAKQWDVTTLDNFHLMNIRVIDDKGAVLGQGRNLVALRKKLGRNIEACMSRVNRSTIERGNITGWDFGSLEDAIDVEQGGISLKAYPAVVEKAGSVIIELADNKTKARRLSERGILRLLMMATSDQYKYISKQIAGSAETLLYFARLGSRNELIEDCLRAIYQRTFLDDHKLPMNKSDFDKLLKTRKQHLIPLANDTIDQVTDILRLRHTIAASVADHNAIASVFVYADIQHQLDNLFEAGFIFRVPWRYLKNFPRYLKAVQLRIEKIQGQLQREKTYCEQLQQFWQQYGVLKKQYQNQQLSEEMLTRLRWLFEEYRVSLYAQGLGTSEPVSKKRIDKLFSKLEL
jgi:ATP-dependent helicase HrpA